MKEAMRSHFNKIKQKEEKMMNRNYLYLLCGYLYYLLGSGKFARVNMKKF